MVRSLLVSLLFLSACSQSGAASEEAASACSSRLFEGSRFTVCELERGKVEIRTSGPGGPHRTFAALQASLKQRAERVAYGRRPAGVPQIDDARMKLADPGLYDAVTRPQGYDWIFAMLSDFSVEAREVDDMIQQRLPSDWPVELRDDLTPEEVEEIRPYTYEGKKTLALKVRYAKESEV